MRTLWLPMLLLPQSLSRFPIQCRRIDVCVLCVYNNMASRVYTLNNYPERLIIIYFSFFWFFFFFLYIYTYKLFLPDRTIETHANRRRGIRTCPRKKTSCGNDDCDSIHACAVGTRTYIQPHIGPTHRRREVISPEHIIIIIRSLHIHTYSCSVYYYNVCAQCFTRPSTNGRCRCTLLLMSFFFSSFLFEQRYLITYTFVFSNQENGRASAIINN